MLRTRIITAIVGAPLLLGVLYLGGIYWQGFIALLAFWTLYEYFTMMGGKDHRPMALPAYFTMGVLLFRVPLSPYLPGLFFASFFLMILFMIMPLVMMVNVAISEFKDNTNKIVWIIIILVLYPIGWILYLIFGRKQRVKKGIK